MTLATVGLIVFGIFAVTPDGTGFAQGSDSAASRLFAVHTWRPTALSLALGMPRIPLLAALVTLAVTWEPLRTTPRRLRLLASVVVAALTSLVVGSIVGRPGPGHLGDLAASNATSFPSIGAALATVFLLTALAELKQRHAHPAYTALAMSAIVLPIVVELTTATAWPLDEVAGIAVGLIAYAAVHPGAARRSRGHDGGIASKRRRHVVVAGVVIAAATLAPAVESYADILTAPGSAPFEERSVEWLRNHGMSAFVDRGESWWLWRHLPSPTAGITALPAPPVQPMDVDPTSLPAALTPVLQPPLTGEGTWSAVALDAHGQVQIATTTFRPDPGHPSLVAAVAWINAATTRVTLIAGTRQPSGSAGAAGGHVPADARPSLLAAFNSGYKMKDTPGGALVEGHATRTMIDGLATLAVDSHGVATVGQWGTDMSAANGYVALRQNLHLMVAHGQIVDGVATNDGGRWGTVRNTLPTWRSGIGVTASGDLVYVAGNKLTLGVLASALVAAGAVNAMELDIHPGMVTFNLFTHDPILTGHRLLPDMTRSENRYLTTDWRDFVMVTARP